MTKKIIAVDADDTLFDENTAVRLYMNHHYGFNHTEADYVYCHTCCAASATWPAALHSLARKSLTSPSSATGGLSPELPPSMASTLREEPAPRAPSLRRTPAGSQ